MSRQNREQARQWSGLVPGLGRDNLIGLGPRAAGRREPSRTPTGTRADRAVVEWPTERRAGRGSRAVPIKGQRRIAMPPPRIWMPAAVGVGIVLLLILAIAVIGHVVNQPRAAVESVTLGVAATSDTALGAVPAPPPSGVEVLPPQPAAPRAPRFSSRPIEPSYSVASGDTLSSIAARYNTNADALRAINNLPDTRLTIGQRLILP